MLIPGPCLKQEGGQARPGTRCLTNPNFLPLTKNMLILREQLTEKMFPFSLKNQEKLYQSRSLLWHAGEWCWSGYKRPCFGFCSQFAWRQKYFFFFKVILKEYCFYTWQLFWDQIIQMNCQDFFLFSHHLTRRWPQKCLKTIWCQRLETQPAAWKMEIITENMVFHKSKVFNAARKQKTTWWWNIIGKF